MIIIPPLKSANLRPDAALCPREAGGLAMENRREMPVTTRNPTGSKITGCGVIQSGGDRIRTCDLEVMSLASYRAAPPRVRWSVRVGDCFLLPEREFELY